MTWQEVCDDKRLADLPYKIELNGWGQIVLSPLRSKHRVFQGRIERHLNALMNNDEAFPGCAIDTADGTKAPDVVWSSSAKLKKYFDVVSWPEAPEICVEVLSSATTKREMTIKRRLYFDRGATEAWLCDQQGRMTYFDRKGKIPTSALCPAFPTTVGD